MPQMNPIWWFSLFIAFTIILITSNSLNYFYLNNKMNIKKTDNKTKKFLIWKW